MTTRREKSAEFDQGYNVMVTGRHVHVTEGMKQHAVHQIEKLDHIGDRIIDVNVTMDIQKLSHRCDVMMKYGHTLIRSHATTTDMYASIDQAVDKLSSQLRKYKKRLQDHYTKGHPIKEIPVQVYSVEGGEEVEGERDEQLYPHRIVATESRKLKILTEDEAIMKMELSGEPLMVYRSEASNRLKVIYRREDGHYGVIEPEG